MSSYTLNTPEIDSTPSQASASTLPSAFNRMIGSRPPAALVERDQCTRPVLKYNDNYNLYELPPQGLSADYSLFALGEPLHDCLDPLNPPPNLPSLNQYSMKSHQQHQGYELQYSKINWHNILQRDQWEH